LLRKSCIVSAISIVCVLSFVLAGCSPYKNYKSEYFTYKAEKRSQTAYITGLTASGKQQKILVLPTEIGKYRIMGIGHFTNFYGFDKAKFDSQFVEKIIIPYYTASKSIYPEWLGDLPNLKKIVSSTPHIPNISSVATYYHELIANENTFTANVCFFSFPNYTDTIYSPFWADDLDAGSKIEILPPSNPTRDGYIFGGWYKEPECINKWDFDVDMTYEIGITRLYAKWEELCSQ